LGVSARFSSAEVLVSEGMRLAFQPGAVALYDWNLAFSDTARRNPVVLPYPIAVIDSVCLRLPDGWILDGAARSGSEACEAASYQWTLEPGQPGILRYTRRLCIAETHIDTSGYSEFRAFANRVAQEDRSVFPLRKSGTDSRSTSGTAGPKTPPED
jgi:hypothetical protein